MFGINILGIETCTLKNAGVLCVEKLGRQLHFRWGRNDQKQLQVNKFLFHWLFGSFFFLFPI